MCGLGLKRVGVHKHSPRLEYAISFLGLSQKSPRNEVANIW